MFKKRKRLLDQIDYLTMRNDELNKSNDKLQQQNDSLAEENNSLRVHIVDARNEFNNVLEAKEAERQELCAQLGELQDRAKHDEELIARQGNTIVRLIKENALLIKTNANLSKKLNQGRDKKGRFTSFKNTEDK